MSKLTALQLDSIHHDIELTEILNKVLDVYYVSQDKNSTINDIQKELDILIRFIYRKKTTSVLSI